jgi:hypothetical protein
MKHLLVIVIALMLSGCGMFGKGMTRLLPKIEKIDLPEELMKKPQDLLIIVKPDPPPAATGDATPGDNTVTPKG